MNKNENQLFLNDIIAEGESVSNCEHNLYSMEQDNTKDLIGEGESLHNEHFNCNPSTLIDLVGEGSTLK